MNLRPHLNRAQHLLSENSPQILTAIAVTGVITTAVLAGKASFKAARVIDDEAQAREIYRGATPDSEANEFTPRDKARLVWKLYLPPLASAAVTIGCIVSVNRIGSRRAAAMAAAYTLADMRFEEYRSKVVQTMGDKKHEAMRQEMAQEHVDRVVKDKNTEVIYLGGGDVLCVDAASDRAFMSTIVDLRTAENDINRQLMAHMESSASLTDFYNLIGLDGTSTSSIMGWNTEDRCVLDLSTTMTEDDRPAILVDFKKLLFEPHKREDARPFR